MAEVRMPKMGDGMEEGTINVWLKKEGDKVTSGDPIAEVETDKANVEITAYETGVITEIIVPVGKTVPVGDIIAVIGGRSAPTKAAPEPKVEPQASSASVPEPSGSSEAVFHSSETAASETVADSDASKTERVKASPLARRMARELGFDLAQIVGSGPGGRIGERDIKAFQARTGQVAAQLIPASPGAASAVAAGVGASTTTAQEIQPSKMRVAIGKRTVLSKQTIPHFYVTMVVEMDRALGLLKDMNADAGEGKVTVNDLIVKACSVALGRVPEVNATFTPEGTIRRFSETHIGVAVGIDEGLIIPVIKDCQSKTLRQISVEAKGLIVKARNNQLKPEEYSGGTFSVSNLGMMGVDEFIAIINPPEAAILAIGGVVREPVVVGDSDQLVIKSRMKVSLSADHRLLDGVSAARFLQEVKKVIEAPYGLVS